MALGIYVSVPFCRSKCSFCNFASGVFSREKMKSYVERLQREIQSAGTMAESLGARLDREVDSVYLGGGTPTTLSPEHLKQIFTAIRNNFQVDPSAEITVECAPGTLTPEIVEALLACEVNRASLGAQSFVNLEIRSVGRLHTAEQARADIAALQAAGIQNISLDLIAGLPHQTVNSWRSSLQQLIELEVPHVSVYMLEADEDSRLGRELLAGGTRYHAHHVPDSDLMADMYLEAIEALDEIGLAQYEISNFSRPGLESKHNLKYWTRQPYMGFGLDAHSMLPAANPSPSFDSIRFGNPDELDLYIAGATPSSEKIDLTGANEERVFLGLRLNRGVELSALSANWCHDFAADIGELQEAGLVECDDDCLRLTRRGRLMSNEVFERFIGSSALCEVQ
ncbi:MAG: radical SAM family heme chaperone HemW [Acidobacteria bacterium]|nr:radical SAM family heme chaperone HemW [Acidobacteriota bacterium]